MHRRFGVSFPSASSRLQKLSRSSIRDQAGFATTAKVIVVSLCATGIGVLATSHQPHPAALHSTSAVAASVVNESARSNVDPDAELREWLREPQPPTF